MRVRATNGLARYSLGNQLLVALQTNGQATYVAGFRSWLALNRSVRKGEKAIRILAPMTVRDRDVDRDNEDQRRTFFRSVAVFDVAQTDPLPGVEPLALTPPAQPISADSHADRLACPGLSRI